MIRAEDISRAFLGFVHDSIACRVLSDGRLACSTPLAYPSGASVVVWLVEEDGRILLTDYSEGYRFLLDRPAQMMPVLLEDAGAAASRHGVSFQGGRLSLEVSRGAVGEMIWRVAEASSDVARAAARDRTARRGRHEDDSFADLMWKEVERQVGPKAARGVPVEGASGHTYKLAVYVPAPRLALEPVSAALWQQATAVYAKYGDLRQLNGRRLVSVVEDRDPDRTDEVTNLLSQVSEVVHWSKRDAWLAPLLEGPRETG